MHAHRSLTRSVQSDISTHLVDSVEIVPQRLLPLANLLAFQLITVAVTTICLSLGPRGWQAAAIGLAVALLFLLRFRGMTLPQWATLWVTYRWDGRDKSRGSLLTQPFDTKTSDGSQMGFRWDGNTLLSLLKIDDNPQAMTVLEPGTTVSGDTLSLQLVADCLQQYDIAVDSIDVISHGARSHGHNPIAPIYDAMLGPLPAIAQRGVWVAVRFDPTRCAEAVRRRGGGREGVLATAATATRRVANRLIEAGLRPQVLTSSEITHATTQLSDGVNLRNVDQTWLACKQGPFELRSFLVTAPMLTTAGLGLLWTIPSYSTTVCVSVRRDDKHGRINVRAITRLNNQGPNQLNPTGLKSLPGQQLSALAATLPVAQPKRPVGRWACGLSENALHNLALPASGCGQLIGADSYGRAVALPLFGPHTQLVQICGRLHLAQQVLLRSLALGARVRVHTNQPAAWHDMINQVGDRNILVLADFGRGSIQAGTDRNYSVEMFDGPTAQAVRPGVTTMILQPPNTVPSEPFDVALELLDSTTNTVKATTRAGSAVVTMVATDAELRYIKASLQLNR